MIDFLIIGQGIAGSILAFQLLEKGYTIKIIDSGTGITSSQVAAGIVNPITGKRFVKSWMIDELLPHAKSTYLAIEKKLNISFLREKSNYKVINNIEQLNDIQAKIEDDSVNQYIAKSLTQLPNKKYKNNFGCIEIRNLLSIDSVKLLTGLKSHFEKNKLLINEEFIYEKILLKNDCVQYNNFSARQIIFCEGYQSIKNPYFDYLPMRSVKGEALIIKCLGLGQQDIVSGNCTITPWEQDTYYIGATYDWEDKTLFPTEQKKQVLQESLRNVINIPFEIKDHWAGIRPATLDRRPFIGNHPSHQNVHIFNGLGTKGFSLAPYFSNQLINFIENKAPLHKEVSIERYKKYYEPRK